MQARFKRKSVGVKPQFSDKVLETVAAARRCVTQAPRTDPGILSGVECWIAEGSGRKVVAESLGDDPSHRRVAR